MEIIWGQGWGNKHFSIEDGWVISSSCLWQPISQSDEMDHYNLVFKTWLILFTQFVFFDLICVHFSSLLKFRVIFQNSCDRRWVLVIVQSCVCHVKMTSMTVLITSHRMFRLQHACCDTCMSKKGVLFHSRVLKKTNLLRLSTSYNIVGLNRLQVIITMD